MEKFWLWVMIITVFASGWCCFGCWEQERVALLQLKAAINHSNGTSLPSWEEGISDCCEWERVECDPTTRRVIELSLGHTRNTNYHDSWYLNASLFLSFTNLISLDLSFNNLHGCVENEGFEKLSSKLKDLEVLDFSANIFDSNIISSIREFSSLTTIKLSSISLNGSIDLQDFNSFNNLKELYLIDNHRVTISSDLNGLKNLKKLDLSYNHLNTSSPGLQFLINLEELYLDASELTDNKFLQSIGVMNSLKILSMERCRLVGILPAAQGLCELSRLQSLNLGDNGFGGDMPPCLANLTSLRLLDISSNNFTGNIASSPLTNLTSLEYLSISNNHFEVPISFQSFFNHSKLKYIDSLNNKLLDHSRPSQIDSTPSFQLIRICLSDAKFGNPIRALPSFLYHQNQLQMIELSRINFGGNFPNWLLENNTELTALIVPDNSFAGPFRLSSHPHASLHTFDISNNQLSGRIPENFGASFPNLWSLNMSFNHFSGSIPTFFGGMFSLGVIDLSNNQLSGGIPSHLAMTCFSLWLLELSNNKLYGPIVPYPNNLTKLQYLNLHGNLLMKIPDGLSNYSKLMALNISQNHLEGSIPHEICLLDYLNELDLSENNIGGTIPTCLNIAKYRELILFENQLQGPLPLAPASSSNLSFLDLSDNHLSGSISNWIGNYSQLTVLLLRNNNFEGKIPVELCYLSYLSLIDLSHNSLSGGIPHCFGNCTFNSFKSIGMKFQESPPLTLFHDLVHIPVGQFLNFSSYPFAVVRTDTEITFTTKGISRPYKGRILDLFSGIDLSCNRLSGFIPLEIGNLSRIKTLNFSNNVLIGRIPITFSNLKNIESLDLSYNELNGEIPPLLFQLYSLSIFNVSYNNLSGRTPPRVAQFGTIDESSYKGNPFLCGEPLLRNCSIPEPSQTMIRGMNGSEEDNGFIDMNAFYGSFATFCSAVLLILWINPYWRQTWFHLVEIHVTSWYYFVVDNLLKVFFFSQVSGCV